MTSVIELDITELQGVISIPRSTLKRKIVLDRTELNGVINITRSKTTLLAQGDTGIPPNAILDGDGNPILDGDGNYILEG